MEKFLPDDYVPLTIVDGIPTAPAYIYNPTKFKLDDYFPNNEFLPHLVLRQLYPYIYYILF